MLSSVKAVDGQRPGQRDAVDMVAVAIEPGDTRDAATIGVYKGLHVLFADAMADKWPKLPNDGPLFRRLSPVDAMIEGEIPMMIETRRLVYTMRGGI